MKKLILSIFNKLLIIGWLFFASCQVNSKEENAAELPNIVLLMGDDHGWDETAYNGHPHLHTPVLDQMAANGLRMDRFYSASPVCSPTRGSVITGRHPNRYGTFSAGWSIRPEEISIAQIMKDEGYATGHFGKWHLGPVKAESPTNPGAMGFDEWVSHDNFFEMNPQLSRNGAAPELFEGESSEIVVAEAIKFIEKAKENRQPFFVVIWYGSPHEPYSGLPEDLALYDNLPMEYQERTVRLTSNETGRPVERPQREVLRERFAEITAMDRSIGQMRDYLGKQGLRENTLLWYFGDNGTPQEGNATVPFRGEKGQVYEGGVRVPSVLEWPDGIPNPMVSDVNTVTSDVLPTLCDMVGQALPNRPLDGISLKPLFDGNMKERPSPIGFWNGRARNEPGFTPEPYIDPELQKGTTPLVKLMGDIATRNFRNFHHPDIEEQDFGGPRAILDNRYKLVIHGEANEDAVRELFDVREDPAEENNLIDAQPAIAEKLEQQLRDWQQSVLESLMGEDYE
ncbi:MAG: sulfatase-like hydrolase/transferase [Anditalea sp.]